MSSNTDRTPCVERRWRVGDIALNVASAGDAGPPVLLLHGFPDHWRTWAAVMERLAPQCRVLAPDLRGINLSDKPAGVAHYAMDALVGDVAGLVQQVGAPVTLVGHDWGGMLAWAVAARAPQLVSRLVVMNAPHPCSLAEQIRTDPAQRERARYMRRLGADGAEARLAHDGYRALRDVLLHSVPGLQEADLASHVAAWSQPGALTAALNWYRALDLEQAFSPEGVRCLPDLGGASGHVAMPTLVVWGEADGSFPPRTLDGLDAWVDDLRVLRLPGVGHWPQLQSPDEVARAILAFMEQV